MPMPSVLNKINQIRSGNVIHWRMINIKCIWISQCVRRARTYTVEPHNSQSVWCICVKCVRVPLMNHTFVICISRSTVCPFDWECHMWEPIPIHIVTTGRCPKCRCIRCSTFHKNTFTFTDRGAQSLGRTSPWYISRSTVEHRLFNPLLHSEVFFSLQINQSAFEITQRRRDLSKKTN